MPVFNPFTSVAGLRSAHSLFEIRLENSFIVFRGNSHEATSQVLKGHVVLCLKESLKVEDIHIRLTGTSRVAWLETKQTATGVHSQKIDKTTNFLTHNWPPLVDGHRTLAPGNYEWPFELLLPGDTSESVEGLYQTGVTYLLKATVTRGKLAKNLHAFKRLRVIRTLNPAALEFNHAMSVENIWTNKVEYSVVIPQKARAFGSNIPLKMRFTPLLKGLDLGLITVKLVEIQELHLGGTQTVASKSSKHERDITTWTFETNREEHWHDNIADTRQEGWVMQKDLPLPKKLAKCVQDCHVQGIKIRHKIKLTVALKNPDTHISELRATLPVSIFISPNMPLDDDGNIMSHAPSRSSERVQGDDEITNMAPPGYGQHVLDQLYDDINPSGITTPSHMQSGINTPFYTMSRTGSSENVTLTGHDGAVPPAALSSRLMNVSLTESNRHSVRSHGSGSGTTTPFNLHADEEQPSDYSQPHSADLSRRTSEEDNGRGGQSHASTPPEPEHAEFPDMMELSKVPSYTTATRTPLPRTQSFPGLGALPDYQTAISAHNSPTRNVLSDPMDTIAEGTPTPPTGESGQPRGAPSPGRRHVESMGLHFFSSSQGDPRSRIR